MTVNIHEAKTHLSRLLERVKKGEEIVIAKAGKPIAKLIPLGGAKKSRRLGFLKGRIQVPEDFDQMGSEEIERLFGNEQ